MTALLARHLYSWPILGILALLTIGGCKEDPASPQGGAPPVAVTAFVIEQASSVRAAASAGDEKCSDASTEFVVEFNTFDFQLQKQCSAIDQGESHSAEATLVGTMEFDVDPKTLVFSGMSLNATGATERTPTGLAASQVIAEQRVLIEIRDVPVRFTATGNCRSGDAINDQFRLYPDGDFNNNIYWLRGRDDNLLSLSETGTLPPGRYWIITTMNVHDWFSGEVDFRFTLTP